MIRPPLLEYPTGTSPGACTHRSTSVRQLSGHWASTITLPGGLSAPAVWASAFFGSFMKGTAGTAQGTKPQSRSVSISRATRMPVWSSPIRSFMSDPPDRRSARWQIHGGGRLRVEMARSAHQHRAAALLGMRLVHDERAERGGGATKKLEVAGRPKAEDAAQHGGIDRDTQAARKRADQIAGG